MEGDERERDRERETQRERERVVRGKGGKAGWMDGIRLKSYGSRLGHFDTTERMGGLCQRRHTGGKDLIERERDNDQGDGGRWGCEPGAGTGRRQTALVSSERRRGGKERTGVERKGRRR